VNNMVIVIAAILGLRSALLSSGSGSEWTARFDQEKKLLRSFHMVARYTVHQVWPRDLCVLYCVPMEEICLSDWRFGGAIVFVLFSGSVVLALGRWPACALFAYLAVLSPTLGLGHGHISETAADRYCHLPCMLVGVPVLAAVLQKMHSRMGWVALCGIGAVVLAMEVPATRGYVELWRSERYTIEQTSQVGPPYYRVDYIMGTIRNREGRIEEAEMHLRRAVELFPTYTQSSFMHAEILAAQQRTEEAANAMALVQTVDPSNFFSAVNRGMLLQQLQGRTEEALDSFKKAVKLDPTDEDAQQGLQAELQALEKVSRKHRKKEQKRQQQQQQQQQQQDQQDQQQQQQQTVMPTPESTRKQPDPQPYLSIVLATRNDDYAGSQKQRLENFFALWHFQLLGLCMRNVEFVVVDWNPPATRPPLRDIVDDGLRLGNRPNGPEGCSKATTSSRVSVASGSWFRVLEVSPVAISKLAEEGLMKRGQPMAEYYAKNVGIRAARGEFVLATNPDSVPSPALVRFLAGASLRKDTFYTASMRFDTTWPKTPHGPMAKVLKKLMKRAMDDKPLKGTRYENTMNWRPESDADARTAFGSICQHGDKGKGTMPGYWDFHAGDFLLATASAFEQVGAYVELPWSHTVDSSILCKLQGQGFRNAVLLPPCFMAHQHHKIAVGENRAPADDMMSADDACEALQNDPLTELHEMQRDPKKWGMLDVADINEVELLPSGSENP